MKVFVYFNLHKKCFSVKALEGARKGRVVAHQNNVILHGPVFKVSQAGRQRVLQEQRKNVHAGVVGIWCDDMEPAKARDLVAITQGAGQQVTYNPYRFDSFVFKDTEQPITDQHRVAALHSNGQRATMHVLL